MRRTYRSRDKPINISDVEDLTEQASNFRIASLELNNDGSVAQVGSHGEVCDGSDECYGSSDVVEDAISARNTEAQSHKDESAESHNGCDSPIPVGAMSGDVDVRGHWVIKDVGICVQRIVCSFSKPRHVV